MTTGEQKHYFSSEEGDLASVGSAPRDAHWEAFGRKFTAKTDRGVFSYDHLDRGTAVLLSLVPEPPAKGTFLDLGCGWGAIALCLAALSPEADVWAIDVNPRARDLVVRNRDIARATNIHVADPKDVPADLTFDVLWSNPPIRIGKEALHELLLTWLARLSPSGVAWLVVQKNLGSDSLADWLVGQGYKVTRKGSKKGFRVLCVTHGHA
jgi:16S rRNA (guanine1207-N2)-methyltransferase